MEATVSIYRTERRVSPARWLPLLGLLGVGLACTASQKDGAGGTGPTTTAVLGVQIGGLPAGTGGRVTVTGPAGYSHDVTGTGRLAGLEPGAYHIAPGYVNAQGQTWTGATSLDSVVLAAGDSAGVSITYVGGPLVSLNLGVAGVQLIQSTQRADNSIPMISNRDALLRVFVTANQANTATPKVRVRIFNGATQVDSLDVTATAASVPQAVDTASLANSWNALIPASRVLSGLSYQVEVDPGDLVAETNEGDNRWPGPNARQAVTIQSVPPLNLVFVPVKQSVNNLTGAVSNANKDALLSTTQRIFPLGTTSVTVRATYTTAAPALDANDNSGAWGQILSETSALQSADGSSAEYVSIVATNYGSGIAGLGWIGAPSAVAWDKAGSAPGVIAHELGHNFGRLHAPCGGPSGPDPSFPYAGAVIGTWGIDLGTLSVKSPATITDLMSYCHPEWISDYTYTGVLTFRGSGPARVPAAPAGDGLLVWGRIRNGSVTLEPAFVVHAPARLPVRSGPNRLEGFDAAGNRIFGLAFEGALVPDLPGGEERQFAFVLPLAASDRARLAGLRLTGQGLTALRLPFAGLRAAGARPVPAVTATQKGSDLNVQWDPSYPLAVIRDATTGEILSLARGGAGRVTAPSGRVVVQLSEGVSSTPSILPAP
jgi:hypothetical protein